jgi:hypothetical protein
MGGPYDDDQEHEAQERIGGYEAQGARLTLEYGAQISL